MLLHLLAAGGALALLAMLPGPDMAVVTRRVVVSGRGAALRTAAGVAAGLLVWGALAVLGLTALIAASPEAFTVVKVLGVGYLLLLGVQAILSREDGSGAVRATPRRSGRPFLTGLTTNLLNPKIALFYTALLPTLAPPGMGRTVGLAALVVMHVLLTFAWLGGCVWALSGARALLDRPRVRRVLDRVTGVALIGFAVSLATQHG